MGFRLGSVFAFDPRNRRFQLVGNVPPQFLFGWHETRRGFGRFALRRLGHLFPRRGGGLYPIALGNHRLFHRGWFLFCLDRRGLGLGFFVLRGLDLGQFGVHDFTRGLRCFRLTQRRIGRDASAHRYGFGVGWDFSAAFVVHWSTCLRG